MAMAVLNYVQNLWPFSFFKFDDLRASNSLVKKLGIPEITKRFVFAIEEPESQAIIYLLCVQNLSERSALDAECLIREVKPDAVTVQVGAMEMENGFGLDEIASKDCKDGFFGWIRCGNGRGCDKYIVPTSSFEVLRSCFLHKINKEKHENVAGNLVLKEIFGIGFNGHLLSAKRAAEEVGASFLLLESPFVKCGGDSQCSGEKEEEIGNHLHAFGLQPGSLVPRRTSIGSLSSSVFCIMNDIQSRMVKSLSSHLIDSGPVKGVGSKVVQPRVDYEAPQFAISIYSLLVDLHDIFSDIPSMSQALAHAQKMLCDISKGELVESQLLSEVYVFRIAVEALRIALNNAGRLPIDKLRKLDSSVISFSGLPIQDKSHVLVAEALRSQTKEFKSIVAIVDSSFLAGLRRHWNTPVPLEIKDMVTQLFTHSENKMQNGSDRIRLLAEKPVVAVGAGATAVIGVSSLSKVVPASTFAKMLTLKVPASLKLMMTQTQKVVTIAFGKTLGPSKVVVPGMASGAKTSTLKMVASSEKIRAVAHSVIASVEKTSLSAIRTTFYEIMRKRRVQPVGYNMFVDRAQE
ncbi:hypothetical protein M9H77_16687 [Catharanthus roseus]|uniref:Uncharacterized protein n=1 Tax=Catharanthus roseus TaxID=4058 RepID=A0ACC0B2G3_CATRO|nr:hypothetical protein M9H77_16687 [Catharanthus roseus]